MAERELSIPEPSLQHLQRRREFLIRTYGHLLAGVVAFVVLEMVYFATGLAEAIAGALLSVNWLLVLGAFIVVAWMARGFAGSAGSRPLQYAGLAGYVVAESIIFVPLLWVADAMAPGAIASAATLTILAFVGLTALVFVSGADSSFLRGLMWWGGIVALVTIVGAVLFGFGLAPMWFSVAMSSSHSRLRRSCTITSRTLNVSRRTIATSAPRSSCSRRSRCLLWYAVSLFTSR